MVEGEDRRQDERIQDDVRERLAAEMDANAAEIQVNATHGQITLTGTVDSPRARQRAEEIAESVPGVTTVMNNLRVRQPGGTGATG
jgi:hyperosmotically inducible periplasmic protein